MGSVIENKKTKAKCQIFTPDDIVKNMLDCLGYLNNLYGKTILESSCGNGQFLKEIVRRYIEDGKTQGLSRTKIKNGLGRDIFGIELDPVQYEECIDVLNSITDRCGLKRVHWQIKQADALREPFSRMFDFAVGNPPYVSYWDLETSEREYVENKYNVCQFGAWDYSYAFLQDGFDHLKQDGKMVYIIPNSIFKTKSGRHIRSLLQPNLTKILDFTTTNIFGKVLTSPAIMVINRGARSPQVTYQDLSKKQQIVMDRFMLVDEWLFGCQTQSANLTHKFGDYFKIATGIATQCNKAYILTDYVDDGEYFLFEGKKIEKSAVRKAASPRGRAKGALEYIIFPYSYSNGELNRYDEETYKQKFPFAYAYLESKKDQLAERDADRRAQWFEYGRSQALSHINQNKLLLSTVITGKVRAYPLESDEVPYSGLFVTRIDRPDGLPLTEAMAVLTSAEFLKYLEPRGINARGKSIRITAENIINYRW
ncbi:MAG: N-6 DNA methylase [Anaerovoracaceae bacterium]